MIADKWPRPQRQAHARPVRALALSPHYAVRLSPPFHLSAPGCASASTAACARTAGTRQITVPAAKTMPPIQIHDTSGLTITQNVPTGSVCKADRTACAPVKQAPASVIAPCAPSPPGMPGCPGR